MDGHDLIRWNALEKRSDRAPWFLIRRSGCLPWDLIWTVITRQNRHVLDLRSVGRVSTRSARVMPPRCWNLTVITPIIKARGIDDDPVVRAPRDRRIWFNARPIQRLDYRHVTCIKRKCVGFMLGSEARKAFQIFVQDNDCSGRCWIKTFNIVEAPRIDDLIIHSRWSYLV